MEEVVVEYLSVEYLYVFGGQCFVVDVCFVECGDVVGWNVLYVFQGQCVFGGMVLDYFWYVQVVVVFLEVVQYVGIGVFVLQVQFGGQGVFDFGYYFVWMDFVGVWMGVFDQCGQ